MVWDVGLDIEMHLPGGPLQPRHGPNCKFYHTWLTRIYPIAGTCTSCTLLPQCLPRGVHAEMSSNTPIMVITTNHCIPSRSSPEDLPAAVPRLPTSAHKNARIAHTWMCV